MRGAKPKRKGIKLQCLECNSVFDDDYRKRHEQTCHRGKRVAVAHKDAPANPFEAAKRCQSGQREYCDKSQDGQDPKKDNTSTGTREGNVEKGKPSFGKNGL